MKISEYMSLDAIAMAELVRNKEISAEELLETALARVEATNPAINAVITFMHDEASMQIKNGLGDGLLSGVPFLLKDLRASYKGVRSSVGNAFMSSTPDYDSTVTERYRREGLVMFGKTNIPQMGLSIDTQNEMFGPTHNPWKAGISAGGSSGGSAAAVAARMVPMAHASDGAGSTRVPSSCCGIFGLKTSRGRVTYGPDVGEELAGISTQHACSISVRDNAAMLDINSIPDFGDPYFAPPGPASYFRSLDEPPRRLRVAVSTISPNGVLTHPDCVDAVNKAVKLCESLGHVVEEADPHIGWDDGLEAAMNTILGVGMFANVGVRARAKGIAVTEADFQPGIAEFLKIGERSSGADYYLAVRRIHRLSRLMAKFHERYDVYLTPSLPAPPNPHTYFDYSFTGRHDFIRKFWSVSAFMLMANASGQPAMTVPLYWNEDKLPIGVQFAARFGDEVTLLQLARQLEIAQPWANKIPV